MHTLHVHVVHAEKLTNLVIHCLSSLNSHMQARLNFTIIIIIMLCEMRALLLAVNVHIQHQHSIQHIDMHAVNEFIEL